MASVRQNQAVASSVSINWTTEDKNIRISSEKSPSQIWGSFFCDVLIRSHHQTGQ